MKFVHLTEIDPVVFERKRKVNEIVLSIIALDPDLDRRVREREAVYVYVFDEEHHAAAVHALLADYGPDIDDATVMTGAHRDVGLLTVIVMTPREGLTVDDVFNRHAVKPPVVH